MKAFLFTLLTFTTVSSFASVVKCDIYSRNESGNWDQVDSLRLGNIKYGTFLQEAGHDIKGLEGKYINVAIGGIENKMTASIDILDGGSLYAGGKKILSAQGSIEQGLSAAAYEKGISLLCSLEK